MTLLERLRLAVHSPSDTRQPPPEGRRRASVLLLFDPTDAALPLLFMLRSSDLRFHAGQIAFPGGTEEESDSGIVATALREASEEVGLDPGNVEVLGVLSPLVTAVSDRWLTPVVGLQREPWTVMADGHEVAEWFHIPLAELLIAPHTVRIMERDELRREVHFYDAHNRVIWGVSAAILHELLELMGRSD
ncbi:MAG: CoA pyrophosphatase [Candidatus Dormibacteraeota bacterium]|nr:CoA pyrophosphatase [Candidatus Dormibacteraeota bacterium]